MYCGVSASAVSQAIEHELKDAIVAGKINLDDPATKKYINDHKGHLEKKVIEHTEKNAAWTYHSVRRELKIGYERAQALCEKLKSEGRIKKLDMGKPLVGGAAKKEQIKQADLDEDIRLYAHLSLNELIEIFGTDVGFVDWLKATKQIEDIMSMRLKNATSKQELISKNLVKSGILDPIELAHVQLLTDGAKTIAKRVCAMNQAERSLTDCEKFVSDQISSFLRPMKSKITKALKHVGD